MRQFKCYECKTMVSEENAIYDSYYFHKDCYAAFKNRRTLFQYICQLFGLKSPGPAIYSQRKTFMEKYRYTDIGMLQALRYAYEVQEIKIDKAKKRIGIIPYVYEDAQKHFQKEEQKKIYLLKQMSTSIEQRKTQTLRIKPSKPLIRKTNFIDPNTLYEMEDEG